VPHAPINDYSSALADPQVAHMGWVQAMTLPNGAATRTFGSPLRLGGKALGIERTAPALGEHTAEIRAQYGSKEDIHA
jgi:crotonobetainyl-CoA:carnitine CoA-transferase CaiB-like acyl-CoA transferase